jgi:hypothetical protein
MKRLGFVEYPLGTEFFLQGGAGIYYQFWSSEYVHTSYRAVTAQNDYGGGTASLALVETAGMDVALTETLRLLIMVRLDAILAYGIVLPASLRAGIAIRL